MRWKMTAENVVREKLEQSSQRERLSYWAQGTVSAENISQRAVAAVPAFLQGFALFQQNHTWVPRSNTNP